MLKKIAKAMALFLVILLFIGLFGFLFGSDNVTLGVSTVLAVLIYLSRDLTANPVKNTIKLILFNVIMGLAAYLSSLNLFLAIPINFISLFTIAATLSYTISSPISTPFSMQYIFLIVYPVSLSALPLRLAALITGALIIMAVQWRVNRNRVELQSSKIFPAIVRNIGLKIVAIKNGEDPNPTDKAIRTAVNQLKRILYDARINYYYFTRESEINLDLAIAFEQFNERLSQLANVPDRTALLDDLASLMAQIGAYFESKKQTDPAAIGFDRFFAQYGDEDTTDLAVLDVISQLAFVKDGLEAASQLESPREHRRPASPGCSSHLGEVKRYRVKLSIDGLSLSYAFRLALAISSCAFLVNYFALEHGSWLLFTISSLTYPFYEMSRQKTGLRIVGTMIGGALVILIFSILQLQNAFILVLLISLFLTIIFMNQYIYSMIFTTITAISSLVLIDNAATLSLDRIVYVIIGGIVVLLLSKFVLPYTEKDAQKDLLNMYDEIIVNFFKDIKSAANYTTDFKLKIMNLMLTTTLIEDKLEAFGDPESDTDRQAFIAIRRSLIINLDQVYWWLLKNKDCLEDFKAVTLFLNKNQAAVLTTPDEGLLAAVKSDHPRISRVVIGQCLAIFRAMQQLKL
ncbi:FUSC family protein [Acetobacterium wieringae]|uniref:FUSC family protein n=1 Tax=Acetobacterium wieringae TaxID=52694 RepID=UPI002B1FC403|nr:FUSC family protein [Acetobacterium wieringae]MEA4804636.1 FUSC family protein [Acetobacterium wieringae]